MIEAKNTLIKGNKGGTIVLSFNYMKTAGKERKGEDAEKFGKKRVYKFKATNTTTEDNNCKVVDMAQ